MKAKTEHILEEAYMTSKKNRLKLDVRSARLLRRRCVYVASKTADLTFNFSKIGRSNTLN